MIGRRELVKALVGAGVSLPALPTISVQGVATAVAAARESAPDSPVGDAPDEFWRVTDALDRMRWSRDIEERRIPARIQSMKSWSPVFKAHVYADETAEHYRLMETIRRNETLVKAVLGL